MILIDTHRDLLVRAVSVDLLATPNPLPVALGIFPDDEPFVNSLPFADTALGNARTLVRRAELHSRAYLLRILDLDELLPRRELEAVRQSVEQHKEEQLPMADRDWYKSHLLNERVVFLNRKKVRKAFKELLTPNGRFILTIHGTPKSGMSHTVELIACLQAQLGALDTVYFECPKDQPHCPETVASKVLDRVGAELPKRKKATSLNWARQLASLVVARSLHKAQKDGNRIWLIIDGGREDPSSDVRFKAFIDALANGIYEPGIRQKLRLILIDYEEKLPRKVKRHTRKETLKDATETDVRDFFIELYGDEDTKTLEKLVGDAVAQVTQEVAGAPFLMPALEESILGIVGEARADN